MAKKTKRERLPEGVKRLADGRWKLRVTAVTALGTGRKVKKATLPRETPLSQVIARLEELRAELEESAQKVQMPTLADYSEQWIERKAATCRPSTVEQYMIRFAHHILPHLGHFPLDQLERVHVVEWRKLIEGKVGAYSLRTVRGWWLDGLRLIRDGCADYGLPDPSYRLDGPVGQHKPQRELRTLSTGELRALVEAAADSRKPSSAWPVIAIMAYTGARRGEALGLRWEDVDFGERVATLSRAVYCDMSREWSEAPPKNGRPRVVGLCGHLVELLQAHRRKLIAKQHPGLESGLVAPARDGGYCSYRSLRQALNRAAERAGIEQKVTSQVLRRSYNTLALQVMDRVVAQAIVGHADDSMTAHYLGLRPETIREAADRMWE
ncbi:MAG: hypothetical protein CMH57_12655 [Myxococcales bacterium]|nr:hypothetical protein [Myxococcales bacterium]